MRGKPVGRSATKQEAEEAEKFIADSTFTGNYDSIKRLEKERVEKELEKMRRQELKKRRGNKLEKLKDLEENLEKYRQIGVRTKEKLMDLVGDNLYFLKKGKNHYVVLSKMGVHEDRHASSDIVLGYICPYLQAYRGIFNEDLRTRGLIIPKNPYTATAYKSKYTSARGLKFKCEVCGYHSLEIPVGEKK